MKLILISACRGAEGNVFNRAARWRCRPAACRSLQEVSRETSEEQWRSEGGVSVVHSSKREKMISSLLLLLVLTSSVCGRIVVNVSQTVYQAVENSNIMMEWIFTPIITLTNLNIYCMFWWSDDRTSKTLYHLQGGVEHPESQDEQFAGRARWDREDLGKGHVRLHLSRLRINDSGIYRCEVFTEDNDDDGGFSECLLNVTAAKHLPEEPKEGEDGAAVNIGVVIGAVIGSLVVLVVLLMVVIFVCGLA
ncbi:butyrophilin subfamily 2 member A2-like isoform X3 [Myripristis murdjan]|uniref:butyrophilin subfamily 2 member A2-like isoform X3 n=1 Tax=Myripristis murdjan TaxID=586833 RepID=UPI0011760DB9|nr:butyrophilin subfamily 2 member A2-like isoform X3 [Myripristis murdjan]